MASIEAVIAHGEEVASRSASPAARRGERRRARRLPGASGAAERVASARGAPGGAGASAAPGWFARVAALACGMAACGPLACSTDTRGLERSTGGAGGQGGVGPRGAFAGGGGASAGEAGTGGSTSRIEPPGQGSLQLLNALASLDGLVLCEGDVRRVVAGGASVVVANSWSAGAEPRRIELYAVSSEVPPPSCEQLRREAEAAAQGGLPFDAGPSPDAAGDAAAPVRDAATGAPSARLEVLELDPAALPAGRDYLLAATGCGPRAASLPDAVCGEPTGAGRRDEVLALQLAPAAATDWNLQFLNATRGSTPVDARLDFDAATPVSLALAVAYGALRPREPLRLDFASGLPVSISVGRSGGSRLERVQPFRETRGLPGGPPVSGAFVLLGAPLSAAEGAPSQPTRLVFVPATPEP